MSGTYEEAELAKKLCVASLLDCITTSTCFSLLTLAESAHCEPLYHAAEQYSLQHFEEAIDKDVGGLKLLNEEQIIRILTSDSLVLTSEYQVFIGLSAWVEADLPERLDRLADLLSACVRFTTLTMAELTQVLDHSQLVASNLKALELCAQAVIQYYMASDMLSSMNGAGLQRRPMNSQGDFIATETDRAAALAAVEGPATTATTAASPPMMLSAALKSGRLELVPEDVDTTMEDIAQAFTSSVDLDGKKTRPRSAKMEDTVVAVALPLAKEQIKSPSNTLTHAIAVSAPACPEGGQNTTSTEVLPARRTLF